MHCRHQVIAPLAAAFLLCGLGRALFAADPKPNELDLKTERVIVFKDGYCLVIKRGTATADKSGDVFTDEVPDAAVLGIFLGRPRRRPPGQHARRLEDDRRSDR